ncbi:helix-turn-helix transcriptional regulator [Inhella proteolytica]|uniref:Helix-turn-helix transcriptional regulator n=1 Tax=Inhella proteolytica TaxID=2795029 RepID=A0A931J019_9BURK|nr:AraC family transcriptional regulator [Inhella proteolytica]MBH9576969.1 helix-turn-helix transcriptional regulator [Inhella proteolytica]
MPPNRAAHPTRPRVSEWHCPGQQSGWQEEQPALALIELPSTGMDLRRLRGQELVARAGTALLHGAHEVYGYASPTARPRRATTIGLDDALLDELGPSFRPGAVHTSARSALLQWRLRQAPTDTLDRDELALMLVESVLGDAGPARPAGPPPSPAWQRLARALDERLATGFGEALSLERLAQDCGASPFHASRVYRRVTGSSLHRQLNRLRLREALFRLPDLRGRLTELALDLGFSSHSHFSSAFRAEYGRTPSALG